MEKALDRLSLAWACILNQYRKKVEEDSKKEGPGLAVFVMREKTSGSPFNCHYVYIGKEDPTWEKFLGFSGNSKNIEEKYDPTTMYLISVQVPDSQDPTETVGNIRAFLFKDGSEVQLS